MGTTTLEEAVRDFLDQKRVAVAGVSRSANQAANAIYRKLRKSDYQVFAVNPKTESVEGDTCYPKLGAIPDEVDAVVIATHPDAAPGIVHECVELGIGRVWMHRSFGPGSLSDEAVALCRENGIRVIPGGCPMMFCAPVDPAHRCMRWFLNLTGKLPKGATLLILLAGIWLFLAACRGTTPEVSQQELSRAQETLQPFKEQLLDALMTSLEAGPANAIAICRERAPEIAAALSVSGVEMGRTSHRLRNRENAPLHWVKPLLAAYLENPNEEGPMALYVDDKTIGYVEPIRTVSFCVACHGPAVDAELLGEIRSLYPEDEATGFQTGDLRGLFWLKIPAS